MSPPPFKVTYRDINLLQLVVAVGLGKRKFDAIFIDGTMKVGMSTSERGGHIDFKVGRDTNVVAKAAE
jgi:hypothetical protein